MGSGETVSHTFEVNRDKIFNLWWVQAMLLGVVFGVVMGLFAAHQSRGSGVAAGLVTGSIGGVLFGLVMGWVTRRQLVARDRRTAAVTAGLTAERRTQALRASRRGPVPDDPAIRAAAAGLTRDQLEQSISYRSKNIAIFGVIGLLELVVLALTSSRWYWPAVLMFAAVIVTQWRQPQALRRQACTAQPHRRLPTIDASSPVGTILPGDDEFSPKLGSHSSSCLRAASRGARGV